MASKGEDSLKTTVSSHFDKLLRFPWRSLFHLIYSTLQSYAQAKDFRQQIMVTLNLIYQKIIHYIFYKLIKYREMSLSSIQNNQSQQLQQQTKDLL